MCYFFLFLYFLSVYVVFSIISEAPSSQNHLFLITSISFIQYLEKISSTYPSRHQILNKSFFLHSNEQPIYPCINLIIDCILEEIEGISCHWPTSSKYIYKSEFLVVWNMLYHCTEEFKRYTLLPSVSLYISFLFEFHIMNWLVGVECLFSLRSRVFIFSFYEVLL